VIRPGITGVLLASALALLKVATPIIVGSALLGIAAMVALRPRPSRVHPASAGARELDAVH
jgi:hypothetical protein